MIFNKTGRTLNNKFHYGKITLDNVRTYKYLGFVVTPSGEIKTGLDDLRARGLKALIKIRRSLGPLFHSNIYNSIHLFNYMVRPILLYCSDFWGCLKHPKNNPITRLHLSFCKQLLGVRKQTNTSGVLLELGTVPILFQATKAAINNWERIRKHNCTKLLVTAYTEAVFGQLAWASSIKETFNRNGMLNVFSSVQLRRGNQPSPSSKLYKRMVDQFHQTAMGDIQSCSRLRLYDQLKTELGREKYLSIPNIKHRQALTRLRLCGHSLSIETGRHKKIPPEERTCPLCKTGVEDEIHFLIKCPALDEIRSRYPEVATIIKQPQDDLNKALAMLSQKENLHTRAKFIH